MSERSLNVAPHQVERVKQALKNKGFNQRSLATELGLSRQPINNFLNGKAINRLNFIECCEKLGLDWQEIIDKPSITENDPNFVGRENAITDLNGLVAKGAKIILIHAAGGVGKTEFAKKYLQHRKFDIIIKFEMATKVEHLSPIEGEIERWITGEFKQETARNFNDNREKLRDLLKSSSQKVGILIDNLEPALKNGKFIEGHQNYVELLRVLANSDVQSTTLITSRERLEDSRIKIEIYPLEGLEKEAWEDYFKYHCISIDKPTIKAMRDAYGGNAKAMDILRGAIVNDYENDMVKYWEERKDDLLNKGELEDLVVSQFERLENHDPDAYKLLCRLGCYRYQDVSTVSTEGLLCLLWNIENNKVRVIERLKSRGLVEHKKGEYWLHPVIKQEAINRIKNTEDWETANRQAAEFWTESVKEVNTTDDAFKSFEAYHHYMGINQYNQAAEIITKTKGNDEKGLENLGYACWRLGLYKQIVNLIDKVIDKISDQLILSAFYRIIGYSKNVLGEVHKAIEFHDTSLKIISRHYEAISNKQKSKIFDEPSYDRQVQGMAHAYYINVGLAKLDLWELDESLFYFEKALKLSENHGHQFKISSYTCCALVKSYLNTKDVNELINKAWVHYKNKHFETSIWVRAYSPILMGKTYRNLEKINESFAMYHTALEYAETVYYTQAQANCLAGLAELYRLKEEYPKAIDEYHLKSIEILDRIGAKCDLAEAYFQLALTYKAMDEQPNSQTYLDKALDLWGPKQIDAPKQIERVQKAMKNN